MPYTVEDYYKDFTKRHLDWLTTEDRLKGLTADEILKRLSKEDLLKELFAADRLNELSVEEIEAYLKKLRRRKN